MLKRSEYSITFRAKNFKDDYNQISLAYVKMVLTDAFRQNGVEIEFGVCAVQEWARDTTESPPVAAFLPAPDISTELDVIQREALRAFNEGRDQENILIDAIGSALNALGTAIGAKVS